MAASTTWERYIALDSHKHYLMIGAMRAQQRIVLPAPKLDLEWWLAWAQQRPATTC